nr:NrsF family protein [uncultured Roseococcus sp.]
MKCPTEELVSRLACGLRPVRRLPSPLVLLVLWTVFCVAVVVLALSALGLRQHLLRDAMDRVDPLSVVAAGAVALLSGLAAFQLALPDRDRRWALLPVAAVAGWLAVMGWGCAGDVARLGWAGMSLGVDLGCLGFIVGLGVPLTLVILWATRHAALRPLSVAALGGLSAAAFANIGMTLIHEESATAQVLFWHGLGMTLVVGVGTLLGRRLLQGAAPADGPLSSRPG